MTDNMLSALNSVRCAMTSGFENSWTIIMADYYWNVQWGSEEQFVLWLNSMYTQVCTCTKDADNISMMMFAAQMQQGDRAVERMDVLDTCSETGLATMQDSKWRAKQQYDLYLMQQGDSNALTSYI